MRLANWAKLIVSVLASGMAGGIGSLFTVGSVSGWYRNLIKPDLNPPDYIFGPVWTTLYLLMGIAFYYIWQYEPKTHTERTAKRMSILLFFFQLSVNALWSVIFFGLQDLYSALLLIGSLWLLIISTIFYFAKISKTSALLLIPYLYWVSFASYLNLSIWTING